MGKRISQEIIDRIPEVYEETQNKNETARILQISVASVNKYLALNDIVSKPRNKITPEIIEKINSLYKENLCMATTARELNISTATVQKYLTEENQQLREQQYDDRDALWYYIYRLFGQADKDNPVSKWNITQMTKFKSQGISYKAQLLTLKYFYEVKKRTTEKSNGSIGIVPFVVSEAKLYYESIADQQEQINRAIQEQLERDRVEIKYNPADYMKKKKANKKKKAIDLNQIEGDINGAN